MKRRVMMCMLVSVMICSFPVNAIAADNCSDQNTNEVVVEDADVEEVMHESNRKGEDVEILIEPTILDEISGEDIAEIINEGLCDTESQVEIVSEDTIAKNGIDSLQGDTAYIYTSDESLIGVTLPEDIDEEDSGVVLELINDSDVRDGDIVNIYNIEEAIENEDDVDCNEEHEITVDSALIDEMDSIDSSKNNDISPEGVVYKITTGKAKKSGSEYVAKTQFVTSVAKGQKKELGYEFSGSAKTSIEAGACYNVASMKAGLEATVSVKIKAKTTYSASGMAAGKNSREFRVKYFKQKYTRSQTKKNKVTGKKIGTKTATIAKPTRYAEYSIDKKVK